MSCKKIDCSRGNAPTVGGLAVAAGLQAPVTLAQAISSGSTGGSSNLVPNVTVLIHDAGISVTFTGATPQTKQTTFTGSETSITATVTTSGTSSSLQLNLPPVVNGLGTVGGSGGNSTFHKSSTTTDNQRQHREWCEWHLVHLLQCRHVDEVLH